MSFSSYLETGVTLNESKKKAQKSLSDLSNKYMKLHEAGKTEEAHKAFQEFITAYDKAHGLTEGKAEDIKEMDKLKNVYSKALESGKKDEIIKAMGAFVSLYNKLHKINN
jgi:hypothetical protein